MENHHRANIHKMTLSALFLAIGLVLPFLTGQIPEIGKMLLPMHIPVMLCGLICGWQYGATVGFILPLLRSVCFGAPLMFPSAVAMAPELAVYGGMTGWLFGIFSKRNVGTVYLSLLSAMVAGRLVWGLAMVTLMGLRHTAFTPNAFLTGAVLSAVPGIIVQLILIPGLLAVLDKTGLWTFRKQ